MSVSLFNKTEIALKMTTGVAFADTVIVMPGEEGSLTGLRTDPAVNPRSVIIKPATWQECRPGEGKEEEARKAAIACLTATRDNPITAIGKMIRAGVNNESSDEEYTFHVYKNNEKPFVASKRMYDLNSHTKGDVSVAWYPRLIATGGYIATDEYRELDISYS